MSSASACSSVPRCLAPSTIRNSAHRTVPSRLLTSDGSPPQRERVRFSSAFVWPTDLRYTWSMDLSSEYLIRSEEEISNLYGAPLERSVRKQQDHLDDYCRAFIARSPL